MDDISGILGAWELDENILHFCKHLLDKNDKCLRPEILHFLDADMLVEVNEGLGGHTGHVLPNRLTHYVVSAPTVHRHRAAGESDNHICMV
jgi:hypothetical protein